jgi:hypothetical protein
MKTHRENGGITPPVFNLGMRWKRVVSFTSLSFYPREKNPRYPWDRSSKYIHVFSELKTFVKYYRNRQNSIWSHIETSKGSTVITSLVMSGRSSALRSGGISTHRCSRGVASRPHIETDVSSFQCMHKVHLHSYKCYYFTINAYSYLSHNLLRTNINMRFREVGGAW